MSDKEHHGIIRPVPPSAYGIRRGAGESGEELFVRKMPIYVMPHNNICNRNNIYCYGALHYYFVEAGLKSFPLFDGDSNGSRVCFCLIV